MAARAPVASSPWLWGPLPDLLLGCGIWYFVAFEIFAVWGREIRFGGGLVWAPILMLVFGVPHHGATLLRVYEDGRDRRAYAFFAVWASLAVWAVFVVGVYSSLVGSVILSVFLTWSPWHYTGQNYGIAVMFLRRSGVELPPHVKRWLYATFILSYLLTVVVMHHGGSGASYAAIPYDVTGYSFLSLRLPYSSTIFLAVGAGYGVALLASGVLLLRRGTARQIAPAAALVGSQALWFSIPVALRSWNVSSLDPIDANPEYYFLWIGVAHAVQYLWVTSYYARASTRWNGQLRYFGRAALAGALVWTVPSIVFAPDVLGRVAFDAGLAALIAATVNLQHFILDGAIWKLRDGRVARILLRSAPAEEQALTGSGWTRRIVWAIGTLCVAVMFVHTWETYFGLHRAVRNQNIARAERAIGRISSIGRDSPRSRLALGNWRMQRGEPESALPQFERAVELQPSARAWGAVGAAQARSASWERASEAYAAALALAPDDAELHRDAALVWIELGRPERARRELERAIALDPQERESRALLRRLESEAQGADSPSAPTSETR